MSGGEADVVVVGAGLAGLACARRLRDSGVPVVVLEARDRVGGRTHSHQVEGATIDLGGQWLGPTQTRMHELVAEFGLATFPTFHAGTKILDVDGKISTYTGDIPSMAPHRLLQLQLAITTVDRMAGKVPLDDPGSAPHAATRDATTVETFKRRLVPSSAVRGVMDVAVRTIFGAEPSELSLLFFLRYIRSGGGLLQLAEIEDAAQATRFVAGAQQVAIGLAERLGDAVVTKSAVRAITHREERVFISTDDGSWAARKVVVAIPPSLAGRIAYEPGLPPRRDALTQRFPMGATTKFHVFYDEPFWRAEGRSGEVVATSGPLSVVFDNSSVDLARPALLGFSVGNAARRLSGLSVEARRAEVLNALTRWFGPRARNPVEIVEKDWSADPWTGGCPTGIAPPGVLTTYGDALRRPCGPLYWAGTETATTWTGYMEGAVRSGDRAAAEVLEAL